MNKISKICEIVNGEIYGDIDLDILGVCDIEVGKENHVSFILNDSYSKFLSTTKASVVIISKEIDISNINDKTFIFVDNPSKAFIKLLKFYNSYLDLVGVSKTAMICESASIGKDCYIGENVVIHSNVKIGDRVKIKSGTVIDSNSIIDNDCFINSNVSINHNIKIGKRCYIESGSVIGSDGFGTVYYDNKHVRIPHIGTVVISNDVLIGSNCSIDRGTINNTEIGENTKLDNMVHIGHNVKIGKGCLICGQVGIGGSCNIGDNVIIGGKVGFIDHIDVGDNTKIVAHSMVYKSIPSNSYFSGDPARDHKQRIKQDIIISKITDIYKKIKK